MEYGLVKEAWRNPFSDKLWDEVVAPNISSLNKFDFVEVDPRVEPDPTQFINTAVLVGLDERTRSRGLALVTNAKNSISQLCSARESVAQFFTDEGKSWDYYRANFHFSYFCQSLAMGHEFVFGFRRKEKYRDSSGSDRQKKNETLWKLYNASKHHEGNLRRQSDSFDVLSFYWSDTGLHSQDNALAYQELLVMLYDLCLSARLISLGGFWTQKGISEELLILFRELLDVEVPISVSQND